MGLDMYAYKTKREIREVDFNGHEEDQDIAYWRKHPNLHGMMEKIYREKGGKDESFNVSSVQLNEKDLLDIGKKLVNSELPSTSGFFFGEDSDEHYFKEDIEFLEKAKDAIKEGYKVYYTSWW